MLELILREDFHWNDQQIKAFFELINEEHQHIIKDSNGKHKSVHALIKAALLDKKPKTRQDWVATVDSILQIYFFPRISENAVNKNILFPHIEVLTGQSYVAPKERTALPDLDLKAVQEYLEHFKVAVAHLDRISTVSESQKLSPEEELKHAQELFSFLKNIPFDKLIPDFKQIEAKEIKALLEEYSDILKPQIKEPSIAPIRSAEFFATVKKPLAKIKAKLQSLALLTKVHGWLKDFGAFEAAPLDISRKDNSTVVSLCYGAYTFRIIKRTKHAAIVQNELTDQKITAEYTFLASGERDTEEENDIQQLRKADIVFDQRPATELEAMTLVANKELKGKKVVPINAPSRNAANKAAIDKVLQDPKLLAREKEEAISKLLADTDPKSPYGIFAAGINAILKGKEAVEVKLQAITKALKEVAADATFGSVPEAIQRILDALNLTPAEKQKKIEDLLKPIRPDTTFTVVYSAWELARMMDASEINGENVILLGISEAPYLQQQKLQTETGLELASLPKSILKRIKSVQITGPSIENSFNVKTILDGMGTSVTSPFFWMRQRPSLARVLDLKASDEERFANVAKDFAVAKTENSVKSMNSADTGLGLTVGTINTADSAALPPITLSFNRETEVGTLRSLRDISTVDGEQTLHSVGQSQVDRKTSSEARSTGATAAKS